MNMLTFIGFFVGGVLLLVASILFFQTSKMDKWETTNGTVKEFNINYQYKHSVGTSKSYEPYWMPKIKYKYTVNNISFIGTTISNTTTFKKASEIKKTEPPIEIKEKYSMYYKGASIKVYYNPKKPKESLLQVSKKPYIYVGLIGLLFFTIGLTSFITRKS